MIAILETELPVDEAVRSVQAARHGAVVTFLGVVRDHAEGHSIQYLEYSAYVPMAEREMRSIALDVQERWSTPCAILHRIGRLEVGQASLVVAVASPHRKEAFAACEYAVERIKQSVPIWKKEVAVDGFWWVNDPVPSVARVPSPEARG
ncbi:MAG TPA: molybdenum cofactor biosynthesis protein MoaE [Abditibacteriaceae bacterium]|nr:molybdenum cofactor biosynthesis protein MoaE [Abditibacteriaceae bacterium]